MKQQVIIAFVVFAVGFGLGYGITWLLVGGGEPAPVTEASPEVASTSELPPAGGATGEQPAGGAEDTPKTDDEGEGGSDDADAAATGEGADAGAAAASDAEPAEEAEPEPPKPEPKTWWDKCVGKRCKVDFGRVGGGLSVREGTLEHGSQVDWQLRFGDAKKIAVMPTRDGLPVEVRGVGLGPDGQPTAAEIEWKNGRERVVGIIALKIGQKRITMEPAE